MVKLSVVKVFLRLYRSRTLIKMSQIFEDNLDGPYSAKHEYENMHIVVEVLNTEKEELRYMRKSAKLECIFCITSFR